MRGISLLWRSFALVAALSLIAPVAFAQNLTEARIAGSTGVAAEARVGWPPGTPVHDEEQGAPAPEDQSLWTWLMMWFLQLG